MRQFYFNDDEDMDEDMDEEFSPEETEFISAQIDLVSIDLNQRLLDSAIEICRDSWLWRFYTTGRKLKLVNEVYRQLDLLMAEK